jgi:hypothetical protein
VADYAADGLTSPLGVPRLMDLQAGAPTIPVPLAQDYAIASGGPRLMDLQGNCVTIDLLSLAVNGRIGAFLQAVVIDVLGTPDSVRIILDRAMQYDGSYEQTPAGTAFTIGQPTLDALTDEDLTIPIIVTPPPSPWVSLEIATGMPSAAGRSAGGLVTPRLLDGNELDLSRGQIQFTSGADAVRQSIQTRLQLVKTEWFLDADAGVPLFDRVLGKDPGLAIAKNEIGKIILGTQHVTGIVSLDVRLDPGERKLFIAFVATTDLGVAASGSIGGA